MVTKVNRLTLIALFYIMKMLLPLQKPKMKKFMGKCINNWQLEAENVCGLPMEEEK